MKRTLGSLLLIAAALVGCAFPAVAATAQLTDSVVVEDQAGVLDHGKLIPAIEDIEFHKPTTVAIYTRRGSASDNLNEEVLRFARMEHPEWLSPDGQKWADGLFLFALDTDGRQVGTYMGEDRLVSIEQREEIQEATKEPFRDAQWTDGTIKGVEKAAQIIQRPFYLDPRAHIGAAVGVGGLLLGFGIRAHLRSQNRLKGQQLREAGNRSFSSVSMDLDATELNASTIPGTSKHGEMVLEKYRNFSTEYASLAELNNEVNALSVKDFSSKAKVLLAQRYAEAAGSLDALDDVIADSNALLNLHEGWQRSWDRQTAPLREDLENVQKTLRTGEGAQAASAQALDSYQEETRRNLEQWANGMQERTLLPDDALDLLFASRERLTGLLQQHAETVIGLHTKNERESALMREELGKNVHRGGHPARSILDTVHAHRPFYSVAAFNAGVTAGQSSVQSARSSSSGSTTGYGSSGGSFSGSGSSSRF